MTKVRLGDVAIEYKQAFKGDKQGVPTVGLEHLIPEEVKLSSWDTNSDNTFTKRFLKGQILLGRRRAYLKKAAIAPFDGICSGDITIIEAVPNKVSSELLPFIIQNDRFFDYAVKGSAGSLSPRVKWEYLKGYEFDLPAIEEQERLAELLWAAYDLKESYRNLIAATDEMAKAKFIEMFSDTKRQKQWKDVLSVIYGKALGEDCSLTGSYPVCGSGGIMGYTERKNSKKSTIIIGRKGNISNPILMETDYWLIDTAFCLDIDKEELNPMFFYYWCKQFDFIKLNKQTALPSLTRVDLDRITMIIPPIEKQKSFEIIARQADKSKTELQQSIENIDNVMKSLLP